MSDLTQNYIANGSTWILQYYSNKQLFGVTTEKPAELGH